MRERERADGMMQGQSGKAEERWHDGNEEHMTVGWMSFSALLICGHDLCLHARVLRNAEAPIYLGNDITKHLTATMADT